MGYNGQQDPLCDRIFVTPHGNAIYPGPFFDSIPIPDEHGTLFVIAPVELPIPKNRTDIDGLFLGAPALTHFGLGFDTKENRLYSIIRTFRM